MQQILVRPNCLMACMSTRGKVSHRCGSRAQPGHNASCGQTCELAYVMTSSTLMPSSLKAISCSMSTRCWRQAAACSAWRMSSNVPTVQHR